MEVSTKGVLIMYMYIVESKFNNYYWLWLGFVKLELTANQTFIVRNSNINGILAAGAES